jgi:hypothetical protein
MSNENPTTPEDTSVWYAVTGCLWCEAGDIMDKEENLIVAETAEGADQAFSLMKERCEALLAREQDVITGLAEDHPDGAYDDDLSSYRWYVFGFEFPRSLFPETDPGQFVAATSKHGRHLFQGLAPFAVRYEAIDGDWSPSGDEAWEASGFSEYQPGPGNLHEDLASAVDAFRQRATR